MTKQPTEISARQGIVIDASDPERLDHALQLSLDYRGDVTVTRRSTGLEVAGYLFDRVKGATPAETVIRMIPANGDGRVTIPVDDIKQLQFSGRDTAAGKSFETWMKKYVEKKLAGEVAQIESESLD
jgi:hypothetical protein